jgi:U3 small nucleolar RNA-associated protein 19
MRRYNLDYPEFYPKLYSLITYDLFHQSCKKKIFFLFDLFLSSSHLPLYLVASFVKRIARVMLHAPPTSIQWALSFIYRQLHRYPELRKMTHSTSMQSHTDPFDMAQVNLLEKTNALSSSLWELDVLANHHYQPSVSGLAKRLFYHDQQYNKNPSVELDTTTSPQAHITYSSVIRSMLQTLQEHHRPTILHVSAKGQNDLL